MKYIVFASALRLKLGVTFLRPPPPPAIPSPGWVGYPPPCLRQGTHHFCIKTSCLFISLPGGCVPVFIYFLLHLVPDGSLHLQHLARVQSRATT